MDNNKQSENNVTPEKTVNLANMTLDDSLTLLWNALNKANSQGVFNIDESYVIKVAHNKIKSAIPQQNQVVQNQQVVEETI